VLRVSPYFQVLALFKIIFITYFHDPAIFKSYLGKLHSILLIQELQAIKFEHHNSDYINQIELIELLRDDCHKQAALISESRGDSNRCTPCRVKPDQHAFHARFTYDPRPYVSHVVQV
jgi:hypothetical protein